MQRGRPRRAVITGIGPITCIGTGVDNFWNGIQAEKSGIDSITSFDPSVFHVRCAGEIRDWNAEEYFLPHRLKRLDRYAQFAVVSAKLALEDARIEYSREKPQDRVGVSFGTALGGVCKAEEQYIRYLKKGRARGSTYSCRPSLRWFSPFEYCNRIRLSRCRHDKFKQLRQWHSLGRRSVALHSRRLCRRSRGGRSRSPADCDYDWRVRHYQNNEQMGGRSDFGLSPVRRVARWICHGRRWRFARDRRTGTRASSRCPHLRGVARIQLKQRRFSHDYAAPERRIIHSRDARSARGRGTRARADRLHQRTRQFDPAQRQRGNGVDQTSLRRTCSAYSCERDKRLLRASARRDGCNRGGALCACVGSAMDSANNQLSKSRSSMRSRRCAESRTVRRR